VHVALVTKYLGHPVGLGTYAERLLEALADSAPEARFKVYVPYRPARSEWPSNVSFHIVEVPPRRAAIAAWELLLAPAAAARARVDLIHYLYSGGPLLPSSRPTIASLLDAIEWTQPAYRRPPLERVLVRRQLSWAEHVVTASPSSKHEIHRLLGIPREKIVVTPLGAPPLEARAAAASRPYWLFLGGTEVRKNLRLVFEALARDGLGEARLKVVGASRSGPRHESRSELMALLRPAEREKIDWLGKVESAALTQLYSEAIGIIYPSIAEGFGLPLLEAMARLTPVIAADIPPVAELAGRAAMLVPPGDPAALRAAMRRLESDGPLRERLVERGLEVVRSHSWRTTAALTLGAYRDALRAASSA